MQIQDFVLVVRVANFELRSTSRRGTWNRI